MRFLFAIPFYIAAIGCYAASPALFFYGVFLMFTVGFWTGLAVAAFGPIIAYVAAILSLMLAAGVVGE